jgi:hypothetical protein
MDDLKDKGAVVIGATHHACADFWKARRDAQQASLAKGSAA